MLPSSEAFNVLSGNIMLPKTYLKTRMQRKQHTTTYQGQHTATYRKGDSAFITDQQQLGNVQCV